jgi:hypothetical protein
VAAALPQICHQNRVSGSRCLHACAFIQGELQVFEEFGRLVGRRQRLPRRARGQQ